MMECERFDMLAAEPRFRGFLLFGLYTQIASIWMFCFSPHRTVYGESLRWGGLAFKVRSNNSVFFGHKDARLTEVDKPRLIFN